MRRILWLAIILFLVIPQAGASGNTAKSSILAEFTNGGFETNPSDPGSGWYWSNNNWTWDGSVAHSGTHSASVLRTGGNETGSVYSEYIALQSSTNYTLNYWLRTESATWYPRVAVYQYTSGGSQTGPSLVAYANIGNGTNGWELISYHFQTLPNASQIQIRLYLYTDTIGIFWFDDFSLVENGPALFPYQAGFPVLASGTDWLSSPTVADLNHDGNNELLIGAGSAVNGWDSTGAPLDGFPLETGDRSIVGQITLADLNNDGRLEITAGTRSLTSEGQCRVFVWNDAGALLPGWPQSVAWETQYSGNSCWITSIVASDINGDHNLELVASTTNNGELDPHAPIVTPNLYAWHLDGTLVSGDWPNSHYNVGVYGAVGVGDINGDGAAEVVVGRDYLWLNIYRSDGQSPPGWPIATYVDHNGGDYNTEQRIEYSVNAPIIADLEGDNNPEIIVAGHVKGPGSIEGKLNSALLVLNADGTRRQGWETAAVGNGILAQVDLPWQGPVVADLNADGLLEIVVATEDGWIRAYEEDKTLLWEFNYTQGATLFATDPVIGDINGDGNLETVFGTYVPLLSESDKDGPVGLWALTSNGDVVSGFPLVVPTPGIRSTPTLADMDANGRLEILAATRSGQVLVWATQTAYYPDRLPWPTGRHDLQRTGTYTDVNSFKHSNISGSPSDVGEGDVVTFSIEIVSTTPISDTVSLTNTVPAGLDFIPGTLIATSGTATENRNNIYWTGTLPETLKVEVTYQVFVNINEPHVIGNTMTLDTSLYGQLDRTGYLCVNCYTAFLPILNR